MMFFVKLCHLTGFHGAFWQAIGNGTRIACWPTPGQNLTPQGASFVSKGLIWGENANCRSEVTKNQWMGPTLGLRRPVRKKSIISAWNSIHNHHFNGWRWWNNNFPSKDSGVSKNRGTPKWVVENGKGWFGGTPILGNTHVESSDKQHHFLIRGWPSGSRRDWPQDAVCYPRMYSYSSGHSHSCSEISCQCICHLTSDSFRFSVYIVVNFLVLGVKRTTITTRATTTRTTREPPPPAPTAPTSTNNQRNSHQHHHAWLSTCMIIILHHHHHHHVSSSCMIIIIMYDHHHVWSSSCTIIILHHHHHHHDHHHHHVSSSCIIIIIIMYHHHVSSSSSSCIIIIIMYHHHHVWSSSSSCMIIIMYDHHHVRSSSCIIIIMYHHHHVWSSSCMIIIMYDHHHVWSSSCMIIIIIKIKDLLIIARLWITTRLLLNVIPLGNFWCLLC